MLLLILVIVFAAAVLIVRKLRERSLYVLFLAAYTQNFILPYLYTHRYIGTELAQGLVVFKDLVLLNLFIWSVLLLFKHYEAPWPRPLVPLLILCGYCGLRVLLGTVFSDEDLSLGMNRLRVIWFPLQIIVVVMVMAARNPEFAKRFLRHMTYTLAALAVVALLIFAFAPSDFWVANANIAVFQADVKGDSETAMNFDEGLTLSGTLQGREVLQLFSAFRAIGTFGEAIALAFSMAVPVLLLIFYFPRSKLGIVALVVSAAALLFSLTRSAWVFCFVVGLYAVVLRRWYRLLVAGVAIVVLLFSLWPEFGDYAKLSVSNLTPSSDNADSEHAEGVLWFYTRGFSDTRNILGKGMGTEDQEIPESGYAYLLEHFGLTAYVAFVWFCVSLYLQLRKVRAPANLLIVAQGIPFGIFVIMHFSQYPFSISSFMSLWYVVGFCLSYALKPAVAQPEFVPGHAGSQPQLA